MIGEPTDPERQRFAAWLLVGVTVALHLWGLYTPTPPDTSTFGIPGLDKLAHVVLFALPTWALVRVVPKDWMALVPMIAHVPISEWVQLRLLPTRTGDVWDAVADLVGIAVGWWTVRSNAEQRLAG